MAEFDLDPGQPTPRANYVDFPAVDGNFWRTVNAIWPDLANRRASIAPARNGMDAKTGKLLHGWPHVDAFCH